MNNPDQIIDLWPIYDEEVDGDVKEEIVKLFFEGSQIEKQDLLPLLRLYEPAALPYFSDHIEADVFQLYLHELEREITDSTSMVRAHQTCMEVDSNSGHVWH